MVKIFIVVFIAFMAYDSYALPPFPTAKPILGSESTNVTVDEKDAIAKNSSTSVIDHSIDPLGHQDQELYKLVFDLQQNGDWDTADKIIEKIDNPILMGHVLAQRYLSPEYPPSFEDIKSWSRLYNDHPQSRFINAKQSTYKSQVNGTMVELRYFSNGSKYISNTYNKSQRYELRLVNQKIRDYLDRGAVTAALSYFNKHRSQSYIDDIDKAQILSKIAAHYMYLKKLDKARTTALKALRVSDQAPLAGWVAGLTAWMEGDFVAATQYFTTASNAQYASPWTVSAASYWGARAATRAGLNREVVPLLGKAIENQRTFYGLIAMKAMERAIGDMPFDFNWDMPTWTVDQADILYRYPAGARALALVHVGRISSAETELYNLPVKNNEELATAAIAFANHYNLAGYAMRFSSILTKDGGAFYDGGLFPISSWTKELEDKALINAFIRQESRFQPTAYNKTGARGLMQIMPETAAFITNNSEFKTNEGQRLLNYPKVNIGIGSQYLKHLKSLNVVKNDLFSMAIAYNAGPGKLGRWKKELNSDDPLLFIELIPSSETRAFVERVVTNYWVYQIQMGLEPKTLLNVAQGQWPILEIFDGR
jgi:soluble lytic murein transglycosylase